jgi:hypothetical protein
VLTPLRSVPVTFCGRRAAEGPLTLGQLNILEWLSRAPDHVLATVCTELEVPDGVRVDDVADTIAVLLGRHEALRTSYLDGEHPRQQVAASGVLTLEVCALDGGPSDRPAVAEALIRRLRQSPGPAALPIRVAVATAPGTDRVIACAAGFSHMAVDFLAMGIIKHEFAEMIHDRSARRLGQPRHQPLDQAELEATPAARRQSDDALRWPSCDECRNACTPNHPPPRPASRSRWRCPPPRPRPPRDWWPRGPEPAGRASSSRRSAPYSPAAPGTASSCFLSCPAIVSTAS